MKKITLAALLLASAFTYAQVETVASTSFEEAVADAQYVDTGDPSVAHDLINNAGESVVDFTATATEMGFDASYAPYVTPDVGLTDGDFVGASNFTGDVGAYTDGVQGYQLQDTDGVMIVEFDVVDLSAYTNNEVSLDYFINETGWEWGAASPGESASDIIHIYVRDLTNATTIDILNTEGNDIDDLMIEDVWTTGNVALPNNIMAQLVVELQSNSGAETLYLDQVIFEGEPAVAANLVEGDLAFIAFNADGDDDLALVTFVDIDPNTEIYFTDTEWNGTDFDSGEGDWIWNSGGTTIPAGTVIVFNTIDAGITSNVGSITFDDAGGISATDEAIFAYTATAVRMPDTFITAIANDPAAYGTLTGTNLSEGVEALTLPASSDIAEYAGTRIAPDYATFKTEVKDLANYNVQGDVTDAHNDGIDPDLPFDETMFILGTTPSVQFDEDYISVSEDGGSVTITVTVSDMPPVAGSVDVTLLMGGTAAEGTDFTFAATETLNFPTGSSADQTLSIPIIDNSDDGSDLFFVLQLENEQNVNLGGQDIFSVYILDDDTVVPAGDDSELDVTYRNSYTVDAAGTAEITAYDPATQRLFVTNGDKIEVLDFSDPDNIVALATVNVSDFGGDGVQSIAVSNGLVAAAISVDPKTDNGFVVLTDADGNSPVALEVGPLPDMLTFSPDGALLVVANEGEPNDDYTVDPEGSISVIDVSGGLGGTSQANVTTLSFNAFDGQQAALEAAGVRIYGPGASVSQDLEPEFVTISTDSQTAYVTLQENNAYAIVDLTTPEVTDIVPFGLKDHSLVRNTLDTSDETDFIFDASWPIFGMYMPDAVSYYEVAGTGYIVTANEGDARDYDTFAEERKLDDADYNPDPAVFSNIDILELETNLGDHNFSAASGDTNGDGLYEELHAFGGRSFSIFEAATGTLVWDSGNDFEVITANDPVYGGIFNASNENNEFKNRSDNKGPEPEGVTVQEINGEAYAFVLLERIGGVMIYNISDPSNPVFLEYENSRDATPGGTESGDLGPEGVVYIAPQDSPVNLGMLVISNEVSGTLSIYDLNNDVFSVQDFELATEGFKMYPNPSQDRVFFSQPGDYSVFDLLGRKVLQVIDASSLNVNGLTTGTYVVVDAAGTTQKLLVE
ncbi:MAG: hypothetical protein CMC35_00505 [Flavobacteriaceae bacterium]|nr:hypothetical protein [Flavobacteriaceae bacterium]|tara:strand:+ start:7227 stop:10631 length:3405 start_codon:yes stop_codon:yes gene_type:complete